MGKGFLLILGSFALMALGIAVLNLNYYDVKSDKKFRLDLTSDANVPIHEPRYTKSEVHKIWSSGTPACIKDGSKLIGVNAEYAKRKLRYVHCTHLNKSIHVLDVLDLPEKLRAEILGR